jgi:hypothetical protein
MPTGEHGRYTLSAVIPRNDWREPIDGLSPMWYRVKSRDEQATISENGSRKVSSIEIVLAKIVCGRYIAFNFFIRYVVTGLL